jgi:hypothetical protein
MTMYVANADVLRRSLELYRAIRAEPAPGDEPAAESNIERAVRALERLVDAELELWADAELDDQTLPSATVELSATWVCKEMLRFMSGALLLESVVEESWADKLAAWREHGRGGVATTIGTSSGDLDAARAYLRHYTEELLGRTGGGP